MRLFLHGKLVKKQKIFQNREGLIMDNENRVIGAKASSTGDKMLRLMKDLYIGIADLTGVSGSREGV